MMPPRVVLTLLIVVMALSPAVIAAREGTPSGTLPDVASMLPVASPLPPAKPRAEGPLGIIATTGILADLVAQVGGERVAVRSLLAANADPHDFEPAPADLVAVEEADLIVRHGLGLDDWSEALVANAGATAPVIVATDGIVTISSEAAAFAAGDPHVWFDPTRTAQMVGTIAAALRVSDPAGAATYDARAAAYDQQLADLDDAIAAAVATIPPERRQLVTNHDALAYFAERYGLAIVGTVIPSLETTAEPSARELGMLLETIAAAGIPAIFAENTTSASVAEQVAEEARVAIVDDLYTDSLGEPGSGAETYLGLMTTDTIVIVEALR